MKISRGSKQTNRKGVLFSKSPKPDQSLILPPRIEVFENYEASAQAIRKQLHPRQLRSRRKEQTLWGH